MRDKKKGPTHSQILGIIWLSVSLLIIASIVFFSSRHKEDSPQKETCETVQNEVLAAKEDSVYHSRRKHNHIQYTRDKNPRADSTFYTHEPPAPKKQPLTVELNSADTLTLQLLHGIGPVFARRIVRYRDRLGGFVSSAQLLEVYGVTPQLLNHIGPHLRIDTTAIKRINPNTTGLKELARHPYIEYYQARDMVRLRENGIRFHSVDDLRAIPSMADSTLVRLLPYLDLTDSIASK